MDFNAPLSQNVNTLFSNLENFTQNEGVIGKPVTHGDKTFIPVVSVTLGYGSGNTSSKNQTGGTMGTGANASAANAGSMGGGALGMGAKLATDAIIVIDKDNVSMMQVSPAANMSQLIDKIPQMVSSFGGNATQQGQQQGQSGQGGQTGQS